jgi:hypothetical protein
MEDRRCEITQSAPSRPATMPAPASRCGVGAFSVTTPAGVIRPRRVVVFDSQARQSPPRAAAQAAYGGAKRRKASTVHVAVDTLGHLLALQVPQADAQDREQAAAVAAAVQEATGERVTLAFALPAPGADAQPSQFAEVPGAGPLSGLVTVTLQFGGIRGLVLLHAMRNRAAIALASTVPHQSRSATTIVAVLL